MAMATTRQRGFRALRRRTNLHLLGAGMAQAPATSPKTAGKEMAVVLPTLFVRKHRQVIWQGRWPPCVCVPVPGLRGGRFVW